MAKTKTKTKIDEQIEMLKGRTEALKSDNAAMRKRISALEAKAEVYEQALDWIGVVKSFWEIASSMAKTQRLTRDK